ncbi:MAG: hypothetical protein DRZ82_10155 [Thermoprotei archaeon]|nr:MAG: hypothetical protein DRZ82_10155 [Thermoprotei archaeon]
MAVNFWDALYAFIQFIMVLSVWSYLYKPSAFSRISAVIVTSISTVHFLMWNFKQVINMAVVPMVNGRWLYIFPIIFGILIYARLSKKYAWLASYSYSITLGMGTGATLSTLVAGSITGLIIGAITEPFKGANAFEIASGLVLWIGVILSMTYWLFTVEVKGPLEYAVKIGRLFLMCSIGILYAEDIIWSQSLLVKAMEMVVTNFIKKVLLGMPV